MYKKIIPIIKASTGTICVAQRTKSNKFDIKSPVNVKTKMGSKLNNKIDRIYTLYINDAEMVRIDDKLKNLGIDAKMFKGVIGREVDHGTKLTDGEYGHSASFIKILEDAVEKGYQRICILEPDIYFCKDFNQKVGSYLDDKWNALYLGASQYAYYQEKTWDRIKIEGDRYNAYKTLGTFAVCLQKDIYGAYLDLLRKFEMPSDLCLVKLQEEQKWKMIVAYPNLISCDITESSTSKAQRPKQTDAIVRHRWSRVYDFSDLYQFECVVDSWYRLDFEVNSYYDRRYDICIGNLPTIKNFNFMRSIIKDGTVYFKAHDSKVSLRVRNLFGRPSVTQVPETTVTGSLIRSQMNRVSDHVLVSYYLRSLDRKKYKSDI